jgi:hypothetical protein
MEEQKLRAPVQCGFRAGYGTLDALFTMQHLLDSSKHADIPLYVCYVDFTKAFDMVRREEILARARQLGMQGQFLQALSQWLLNSDLQVQVQGKCGTSFSTYRGTKQGGRLSPLCFGMFIEQLHELIVRQVPGAGPVVENMRVPDLMYADDVKLIALSPEQLQQLLDVLDLFCTLFDMQVNVSPQKTCVMVYPAKKSAGERRGTGRGGSGRGGHRVVALPQWKLGHHVLPVCEAYIDLGIHCTASNGMSDAHKQLATAGRRAMHAVLTMCSKQHISQPDIKMRMFDALVKPVLSYGCQVWGPELFHRKVTPAAALKTPAEAVHVDFLRMMAGVGRTVKHHLLLADFMRYPIMWHWVVLAVRWWLRLTGDSHRDSLAAAALRDNVRLMLAGCKECWAFRLLDTLSTLGVVLRQAWMPSTGMVPAVQQVLQLNIAEKDVLSALQHKFDSVLVGAQGGPSPRDPACPSSSIMVSTYLAWVRAADLSRRPMHLKHTRMTFQQVQCVSRLRLGWHKLAIQEGRFRNIQRDQRGCPLCVQLPARLRTAVAEEGAVEDILHFVVECPALDGMRERFPVLYHPEYISSADAGTHARYVFNHKHQGMVATALQSLLRHREELLGLIQQGVNGEELLDHMLPDGTPLCVESQRLLAAENYSMMMYEDGAGVQVAPDWY